VGFWGIGLVKVVGKKSPEDKFTLLVPQKLISKKWIDLWWVAQPFDSVGRV
jgi:hypothetical protein